MRKIYQEYFHIPERGKGIVREKVFFARFILSVVFIVCCMFALGYNAYAYFTASAVSKTNIIESARYAFDRSVGTIVVVSDNGSVSAGVNDGEYRLEAGTYDFILSSIADDITGYGRIDVIQDEQVTSFYTRQIVQEKSCTIRIMTDVAVDIEIIACWGTYSNPDNAIIEYGNELNEPPQMIYVDYQLQAMKATWSEPVAVVTSDEEEPVDVDKEEPVDVDEEEPVNVDEEEPVNVDEEELVNVDEEEPIDVDEEESVKVDEDTKENSLEPEVVELEVTETEVLE